MQEVEDGDWNCDKTPTLSSGKGNLREGFEAHCRIFEVWLAVFQFLILANLVLAVFLDAAKLFQCQITALRPQTSAWIFGQLAETNYFDQIDPSQT